MPLCCWHVKAARGSGKERWADLASCHSRPLRCTTVSRAILVDGPNLLHGLRAFNRGERNLGDALRGLHNYFDAVSRAVIYIDQKLAQRPAIIRDIQAGGFEARLVASNLDTALSIELIDLSHANDHIVLVSGDADFATPVANVLRAGVAVTVVTLTPTLSRQLAATGATIIDIIEMLVAAERPGTIQIARDDMEHEDVDFLRKVSPQSLRTLRAIEAGVGLERELRRLCLLRGIALQATAGIGLMNDALLKQGIYSKLLHRKIAVWAEIRNNAAHGLPAHYTSADLRQMEEGVRELVRMKLA